MFIKIPADNNGMSDFHDYSETAGKALQLHLFEKISTGKLSTFKELKAEVSKYTVTNGLRKILFRAFYLQRKLYWGFFKDINPKAYPDLWNEIVIPDHTFKFAGDLKRAMSIPDIYLGLLDIHGYTKYCYDKKRNMSMIDLLDRMIYEDVNVICAESGVISKRARGDEILLVGASAESVLRCVLQIMEYFNTQGRSFRNTVLSKKLPGTVLPKFQISAGIAGGQKFTPLIITRDGDLSGDIVNTAARLQSKANRISPDKNRIMMTNHIYQKLRLKMHNDNDSVFKNIDFFNVGSVEFKGTSLNVYDIIFMPEEAERLKLLPVMEKLYDSLEKKMWKNRVLTDALDAVNAIVDMRFDKGCKDTPVGRKQEAKLKELTESIRTVKKLFNAMYYDAAINKFAQIVDEIDNEFSFDPIVCEYLNLVKDNYLRINSSYAELLDKEAEIRLNEIYSLTEKKKYLMYKEHSSMYNKIRSSTRLKLKNRKKLWLLTTGELADSLDIKIKSFKV